MFFSRGSLGTIEFAFTNREDGYSDGPYSSLNLGSTTASGAEATGDNPALVARNLAAVAEAFGVPRFRTMTQVHGADVAFVVGSSTDAPVADAMVTDEVGLALIVRAADCTPIVLADPQARLVGVVHAGRAGLVNGVAPAAVRAMRDRGATRIQAWIGPRVCGSCYELPQSMVDEAAEFVPEARSNTAAGKPALDVGRGVIAQLKAEQVDVTDLGLDLCTMEDKQFFSYRRQGKSSGRQGAIVVLRGQTGE
ncbi:MAG: polyphenol oxidase family protein [Aeromicrobium sp.]